MKLWNVYHGFNFECIVGKLYVVNVMALFCSSWPMCILLPGNLRQTCQQVLKTSLPMSYLSVSCVFMAIQVKKNEPNIWRTIMLNR